MATLSDAVSDMVDNVDFEEVGSVAKARAFITAANKYLILKPTQQSSHDGSSLSWDVSRVEGLLARARDYVSTNSTGGSGTVRFLGVSNGFRG